jgi:hypothetical protein
MALFKHAYTELDINEMALFRQTDSRRRSARRASLHLWIMAVRVVGSAELGVRTGVIGFNSIQTSFSDLVA